MRTTNEQKLVDICFECVLTALDHEHVEKFVKMTIAERAEWVARQLRECGFDTEPVGASWGSLKTKPSITPLDQRRLRDADAALALPELTASATKEELTEQFEIVRTGIAALQSLDDLGAEMNKEIEDKGWTLWEKFKRLAVMNVDNRALRWSEERLRKKNRK